MTGTAIDLIDTALLRQYPEEATTADVALLLEEVQRLSHLVDVDVADDALLQRIAAMAVDLETATTELNRKERELETWRGRAIDAELEAARIHHMMGGSDLASGEAVLHGCLLAMGQADPSAFTQVAYVAWLRTTVHDISDALCRRLFVL
ncbi:MAG: hypothetical protein ABSF33_15795 [Acidimicrobiales bacterium]|jgi:hypothetical protein